MKRSKNIPLGWKKIKLMDRFLIVIMIILVMYSASTMFINTTPNAVAGDVDVVIRTTIASIFGYFISSNFVRNKRGLIDTKSGGGRNTLADAQNPLNMPNNNWQVMIVGTLCICSIFVLISVRYFANPDATETATLSQFRDIICGSIGFLIGIPADTQK